MLRFFHVDVRAFSALCNIRKRHSERFGYYLYDMRPAETSLTASHLRPGPHFYAIQVSRLRVLAKSVQNLSFRYLLAAADDVTVFRLLLDRLVPLLFIQLAEPVIRSPGPDVIFLFNESDSGALDQRGHITSDRGRRGKARAFDGRGVEESRYRVIDNKISGASDGTQAAERSYD